MNFATAPEFYDFCVDHEACEEGLVEIKGLTLAEWWDETKRGDWMLWLRNKGVWDFTPVQLAEYERITAPALAEYMRTTAPALAEYKRITAPALAEYGRITAQAIREIIGNPFKG